MPRGHRSSRCAAPVLRCSRGRGCELTMATRPTGTSSRRRTPAAAGLDCATAFQKIALGLRHDHQGPSQQRVRRRCRGRAPDPGRDHASARRRGVLRTDRGRCGVASPEEGNRLAERSARCRARQRRRHGVCAPQAISRMGATHDRRTARSRARRRITAAWFAACAPSGFNA